VVLLCVRSSYAPQHTRASSRESASEHETVEGYEPHFEHFEGGWTVGFETYTQDADLSPFFNGLPDDQCQCEHMGYVIKGKGRLWLGRRRGGLRDRRRLLHRPGAHPGAICRDRGGRVQPDRGAGPDDGGRNQEHGRDAGVVLSCPSSAR
jgi:hypothetical protein